jgi:hypothetical protein
LNPGHAHPPQPGVVRDRRQTTEAITDCFGDGEIETVTAEQV